MDPHHDPYNVGKSLCLLVRNGSCILLVKHKPLSLTTGSGRKECLEKENFLDSVQTVSRESKCAGTLCCIWVGALRMAAACHARSGKGSMSAGWQPAAPPFLRLLPLFQLSVTVKIIIASVY